MDIHTNMQKKDNIKGLFFNYATKQWHFNELVKKSGMSRAQTNTWLKRLVKEGLIKRIKPKKKMPYYTSNYESRKYKTQKRLYALAWFEKAGFLEHLSSLKSKTIIIFGSFARADWHDESDIDLFIYGNADAFEKGCFERKLKREIQVFHYQNVHEIQRLDPTVIPNILSGIHIKGNIKPFEVRINA
jgi:predicted nucleotidyltransferase